MTWFYDRMRSVDDMLVLPGAYDPLSARLLARSGTEAVYCGGFAATAAQYALPDLGLLSLAEMVEIYRRIKQACQGKPLVVDGDAGHGGLLNVERTVTAFGMVGVDAFHIEDQEMPKRCGHLDGKDVVSSDEAIARVKTAVDCSAPHGIGVIGRTDAIAVHGFQDALQRANAFLDAGAAAAFIDAPQSLDQIRAIPKEIDGPVIFNAADTGTVPPPSEAELAAMGYAAVLHPLVTIMDSVSAITKRFPPVGEISDRADALLTFSDLNEVLETNQYLTRERRWAQDADVT